MWASSAERDAARRERLMDAALVALDAHLAIIDADGTFAYLSENCINPRDDQCPLISAELGGNVRTDGFIGHRDLMPALRTALTQVWQRGTPHYGRQVPINCDGETRWIALETHRLDHGAVMVLLRDTTDATTREQDLHAQATRDPVTDIANRRMALQVLDTHLRAVRNGKMGLALLICDLDEFKEVNDTYGHAAGDDVLRAVAKRWTSVLREQDLLARIGGDEFLILAPDVLDIVDAHTLAGRLAGALAEPIRIGNVSVAARASVGGVLVKPGAASASSAVVTQRADRALYAAKRESDQHIHISRMNHSHR